MWLLENDSVGAEFERSRTSFALLNKFRLFFSLAYVALIML